MPQELPKKVKRPDTPLAPTSEPTSASNGTYYASSNGKVGRISGSTIGNTIVEVRNESIDTTGYSKGKKEFNRTSSSSIEGKGKGKVMRKDVPKIISELKSGTTRKVDYRTPNQKKINKI